MPSLRNVKDRFVYVELLNPMLLEAQFVVVDGQTYADFGSRRIAFSFNKRSAFNALRPLTVKLRAFLGLGHLAILTSISRTSLVTWAFCDFVSSVSTAMFGRRS